MKIEATPWATPLLQPLATRCTHTLSQRGTEARPEKDVGVADAFGG